MQKKLKQGSKSNRKGLHGSAASLAALQSFTQVSDIVRVKLVDFAHSTAQVKSPGLTGVGSSAAVANLGQALGNLDEDYLLGLESLIAIIESTLFPKIGTGISIRKDNKELLWIQELKKARRSILVKYIRSLYKL